MCTVYDEEGATQMFSDRRFRQILPQVFAVALAALLSLGVVAQAANKQDNSEKERVLQPVKLAVLIQDNLVSHVSNEIRATGKFIEALPKGSEVMVGYITAGSLQVRQPFTPDLAKAAGSLRILISSPSATPYNPYVEVLEALRKFDSNSKTRNVVLLVSDGLDTSRGFDPSSILDSVDLKRAVAEANRRDVSIYSFFAPSIVLTNRSHLAATYGQSSLAKVAKETGGEAFFQGTTDFVTFDPFFERFVRALNRAEPVNTNVR